MSTLGFAISARSGSARAGIMRTPHGDIRTPAFIPVGTKATVKAVLPESLRALGAQAVLANAYHLYLQPGADIINEGGGLATFMGWGGPTFTDSGGFQVLSLGAGFKKVLAMDSGYRDDDVIAEGKERLARVDDDGVTFRSHLDGSEHRFSPEVSMRVQAAIGADIAFAFDELTTLNNTRSYQEIALERTRLWAERCLVEHAHLRAAYPQRPAQALFGVIQGAQYEDLRRRAARDIAAMDFDGFGIGGAIEKRNLAQIVTWVTEELPDDRPRHLLGIGEPGDLFAGVAAGADTFDCVSPSREARNSAVYTSTGRFNLTGSAHRRDFGPIDVDCGCYTCTHYSRAYLHHAFKAKEMVSATLATVHNLHFTVSLVDRMRVALESGDFDALREEFLGRYYAGTESA
ncbi:MAG: tRNA guanosine(34) transglycosylase Tgt [Candidatus Nanopelagicales bacterium]